MVYDEQATGFDDLIDAPPLEERVEFLCRDSHTSGGDVRGLKEIRGGSEG